MQVRVRYFHSAREARGLAEETIELLAGSAARDLLDLLSSGHPRLAQLVERLGPSLLVAVNREQVSLDHRLEPDCEVALLPPFSGG